MYTASLARAVPQSAAPPTYEELGPLEMAGGGGSCAVPITRGPRKGQLATGTISGFDRHRKAGEKPCDSCADAMRAWSRDNYAKNRERAIAYQRTQREQHPERYRQACRDWYQKNAESQRDRSAQRRREHPDAVREAMRRWREANPAKIREYRRRRRARIARGIVIPFSQEELAARLSMFGYRCWLRIHCDGAPYAEVDHVIPIAVGGPHCLANLRPACHDCNAAKGAKRMGG